MLGNSNNNKKSNSRKKNKIAASRAAKEIFTGLLFLGGCR
jgi:hypothetical protein